MQKKTSGSRYFKFYNQTPYITPIIDNKNPIVQNNLTMSISSQPNSSK